MITIDQLLESVDLNFKQKWITKDKNGEITIFAYKPELEIEFDRWVQTEWGSKSFGPIKLAEFEGKDWTECIYEVPRKTTGKIDKLPEFDRTEASIFHAERLYSVVNNLVEAVNELKEKNNG